MIIEKRPFGLKVTIPETEYNSEFEYSLRQVRTINKDCKEEQELIAEIEKKEKPLTEEFLKLAAEMEGWLHKLHTKDDWDNYTAKYGDFNYNYHYKMSEIEKQIQDCSFEYARRSKHGWRL